MEPGKFLVENCPAGDPNSSWVDALEGFEPTMDGNGFLNGQWGKCLMAAIRYERTHRPRWNTEPGYEDNGPCGQVIDYLASKGMSEAFETAANELENATKTAWSEVGHLECDETTPEVWEGGHRPAWEPDGFHEQVQSLFHDETVWCCVSPLICGGFGCAHCCNPCYMENQKCCCIEGIAHTEDCCTEEAACHKFEKLCCLVSHYGCPPGGGASDGVPTCACCNKRCGGEDEAPDEEHHFTNDNAKLMGESFLCMYCCCLGFGFTGCCDPCYRSTTKCLCIKSEIGTADCCPERGCCYAYGKMCCCINAFAPPCVGGTDQDGIPTCAFLGQKCGEDDLGRPAQQTMRK